MRCRFVWGVGWVALGASTAWGQFAVDRNLPGLPSSPPPRTTSAPAGMPHYTPLYSSPAPAAPAANRGSSVERPVTAAPLAKLPAVIGDDIEIPTALPKDHPWLLKPEHGPYFILVKSYVRPAEGSLAAKEAAERGEKGLSARELAEMLASEIRETHRVQAFLYEYISEDQKAEIRAYLAAKRKAETEYIAQVEALKQKALAQGMIFEAPDNKLRMRMHDRRDQIGVLVGGFQSEADARKALAILKKWPPPKNEVLMDKGIILSGGNGQPAREAAYINPYANAFVVANPTITQQRPAPQPPGLDPFIVKLNEDNPYSLLKATKKWTLCVKTFHAPVELVSANSDTSLMKKFSLTKGRDYLIASAEQAEAMAKAIRELRGPSVGGQPGQPLNLEAFVLHTRNSSIVTVGQFDSPDDPELLSVKQLLASMKINVTKDAHGLQPVADAPSLFEKLLPMPIPK